MFSMSSLLVRLYLRAGVCAGGAVAVLSYCQAWWCKPVVMGRLLLGCRLPASTRCSRGADDALGCTPVDVC